MRFRNVWYDSADGLRLFARDYSHQGPLLPVLCLPGLTRNARDFEDVAERLSAERRVICPDFRGRGASQYAGDPKTYRPDVEMADTLALLDHLGIARTVIIGTSRGGLVGMMMAAAAPERVAGLLLNDIGPRLETDQRTIKFSRADWLRRNARRTIVIFRVVKRIFERFKIFFFDIFGRSGFVARRPFFDTASCPIPSYKSQNDKNYRRNKNFRKWC